MELELTHFFSISKTWMFPVISLTDLENGHSEAIHSMTSALMNDGLFYLGVPGCGRNFGMARALFSLDPDVLQSTRSRHLNRGYLSSGEESGSILAEPKESFAFGSSRPSDHKNDLNAPNVWPGTEFGMQFRREMDGSYEQMVRISQVLLRILATAFNFDFEKTCGRGHEISLMRIFLYHRKSKIDSESIGSSPHTDWGLLTLISQDKSGLQVCRDGAWVNIPAIPETLVVNGGDFLCLLTDGKCTSPLHRVISPSQETRTSYVFVCFPCPYQLYQTTKSSTTQTGKLVCHHCLIIRSSLL